MEDACPSMFFFFCEDVDVSGNVAENSSESWILRAIYAV